MLPAPGLAVLLTLALELAVSVGAGCSAGLPRRSTGRLGSSSSGDAAGGAFETGACAFACCVLSPSVGLEFEGADEELDGEAFSVGRSESSSDFGGALLFAVELPLPDGVEFPPDVEVGALLCAPLGEAVSLAPGRRSTGRPGSSLSTSCAFAFGLGCFAACAASRASTGVSGFHCPSATQLPSTSRGVVTVNQPAGSPQASAWYRVSGCSAIGSGFAP